MSEWQTIETVPDSVLSTLNSVLLSDGMSVYTGWFCDEGRCWYPDANDVWERPAMPQPTHWMPLPTAPTSTKARD